MEELENALRSSPFIFKLPESLRRANPDSFLPRLIALGPQNAKNGMELYKLYMATKVRQELQLPQFDQLCSQLQTFKLSILACYQIHLEIDAHNLARVMLVDALFLFRLLLNISLHMENSVSIELPLQNFDGQISSLHINHEWLLNDVLKLENQIPILIFQGILPQPLKVKFPVILYHFCQSLSPFAFDFYRKWNVLAAKIDPYDYISVLDAILNQSHHLLHFMYLSILIFPGIDHITLVLQSGEADDVHLILTFFQKWFSKLESVLDLIQSVIELIGLIQKLIELIRVVKKLAVSHKTTSSHVIPSASQLQKLPVEFNSFANGILNTSFTKSQGHYIVEPDCLIPQENPPILNLPVMNINAYTETLFENLLAFEAMANINPPVFSLYIEFMNALIRSPKDVQILKKNRIINCQLDYDDEQVVMLFKKLGSTISNLNNPTVYKNLKPTTSSFKIINKYEEEFKGMVEEINQYYHSVRRVKATRFRKKFVRYLWNMISVLIILFQILVFVKKMVSRIIENYEADYDEIPAT